MRVLSTQHLKFCDIHSEEYVPHTDKQHLGKVRNDYDFPVQLVGKSSGDGALLMMIYRAD